MIGTKIASVVAAAGDGRRMGGKIVKTYQKLGSVPLLFHALARLSAYGLVQPVIREADRALYQEGLAAINHIPTCQNIHAPVIGGATRAASVCAGLEALRDYAPEIVLLHDGARPFIPLGLVDRLVAALKDDDGGYIGAAPALPINDTLKKLDQEKMITIDRTGIFRTQTPQAFLYSEIRAAHKQNEQNEQNKNMNITDDLVLLEMTGQKTQLVAGDERNIKITEARDFAIFQKLHHRVQMGLGVDAHRFGAGDHIWLGGHRIAHDQGIDAHSDGDVVLHALADAIFGITGAGDLGSHFPSSDPQWRDVRSKIFVDRARAQLTQAGFAISNVDITIICAKPAIAPHREAIREQIARALSIDCAHVSVKATTTDGMGLTGNNEGIAAQAIVSAEKVE